MGRSGHDKEGSTGKIGEVVPDLSWIQFGVAFRPLHPGDQSGDQYLIHSFSGGALAAVVDGLGHGAEAAEAAGRAIDTLREGAHEPLELLVQRCHAALNATRGAVMSLASFRAKDDVMAWLGVGNVTGILRRFDPGTGPAYEWLLSRGGIVGRQLPALLPRTIRINAYDTVILATDGVYSNFADGLDWRADPQWIADTILNRNGRGTDDALVMTVRYAGSEKAI